ncbi:parallel beta-helix repeat-containing protein, partial [Candidatus Magnetomorum sp. HK-1]
VAGGTIEINEGGDSNNKALHAGGTGNILLKTKTNNIQINESATLLSDSGHITIVAANDINQLSNANISTTSGSIDLKALAGSITMNDNALINTETDNIRLWAEDDIKLGGLKADTGSISITSLNGNILDNGDKFKDIKAVALKMIAGIGIGTLGSENDEAIDISVEKLTAHAGSGGINILEVDDIEINTIGGISLFEDDDIVLSDVAVTMNVVNPDSTIHIEEFAIQSDLMTSENGSIVLTTQDGSISIHDGFAPDDGVGINADGTGNILIQAQGEDHNITFDANIISDKGNISIIASDSINQKADISTSGGTIDLEATTGSIIMDDGTTTFGTENIRYNAKTDLSLGVISTTADVSLLAESIIDSGNAEIDIIADALRIITTGTNDGDGAGFSSNHIETNINLLAADIHGTNSGGLFITETNAITIDQLNAIAVNLV